MESVADQDSRAGREATRKERGTGFVTGAARSPAALVLIAIVALLGLFLLYIAWPGRLVYPDGTTDLLDAAAASELQRQHNRALEDEIRVLRSGLDGGACVAPAPPGGRPVPSAAASPSGPAPGTSEAPSLGAADGAVGQGASPPAAPAGAGTPDARRLSSADLLARLEEATVFVVGATADGLSTGSGVLVSERLVLTNLHVVEGVVGSNIRVAGKSSAAPLPARVVGSTASSAIGGSDFALLELSEPLRAAPMPFTSRSERLDSIVAAGFPSFVVQSDPEFRAAFEGGDMSRLSSVQLAVTEGIVTQKQAGNGGTTIIGHTATTSPGNSGGPLADRCGRIVGLNTFVRTDAENALRLNIALSAHDAVAFLRDRGVTAATTDGACADTVGTSVVSDPPVPAAAVETAAEPSPTPSADAPPVPAAPSVPAQPAAPTEPAAAPPAPAVPAAPPAPSEPEPSAAPRTLPLAGPSPPPPSPAPAPNPLESDRDAEADFLMPPSESRP